MEYPDVKNYSLVKLTCQREILPQDDAEFFKDGAILTTGSESHQVTINSTDSGEITFSFTQEQDGYFSCHSRNHSSAVIGLAGIHYNIHVCNSIPHMKWLASNDALQEQQQTTLIASCILLTKGGGFFLVGL